MNRIRKIIARNDDGVAFLTVILLMTMVTFFAIMLLGLVLAQTTPTLVANKNARTLTAARAGIDAAIGQFRNATSPDATHQEMGDIHKLPCVVEGTVDGTGGATHYKTSIQYFKDDPDGQDGDWRAANAMTCYTGGGNGAGLHDVPHFAVLTSEGFDDTSTAVGDRADRVVEATYTFKLTTVKVSGGLIMDANLAFCLVATGAAEDKNVVYEPADSDYCSTLTDLNSWSWRNDYMIHLTSSDAEGNTPLCITGRPVGDGPTAVTLQPCTTTDGDPVGQRWSWTGSYTWQGQNKANTDYANVYIVNQYDTVSAGNKLSVATSANNASLTPTGAVGKGGASYDTKEVVNQNLFGRCLDVTNEDINHSYMIAYPCKQDPSHPNEVGNFKWNHKWYYDEPDDDEESTTTKFTVYQKDTTAYCLVTTSSTGLSGTPYYEGYEKYKFPKFYKSGSSECKSSEATWTRYKFSYDVTKSYTIRDSNGLCLSANGPQITQDGAAGRWTSIIVSPCDGSDAQKWNVPDKPVGATIGDFEEVTGRTGG